MSQDLTDRLGLYKARTPKSTLRLFHTWKKTARAKRYENENDIDFKYRYALREELCHAVRIVKETRGFGDAPMSFLLMQQSMGILGYQEMLDRIAAEVSMVEVKYNAG